jgi:hypothetical protein
MNFARIAYAPDPESGTIPALIFVGTVERVRGSSAGRDVVIYVAKPAARFFTVVASFLVRSILRFERRQ